MNDLADYARFLKLANETVSRAMTSLAGMPAARSLDATEIAVACTLACIRAQALAMIGGDLDPRDFDGELEKFINGLRRRVAERGIGQARS